MSDTYIYDMTDTWNNAGTTFNGIKINVTDTASAAGSKLMDLQVASTSKFAVAKGGDVTNAATTASTSTTTGALTVAGGVGIGGALNVGGNLTFGTNVTINNSSGYVVIQSQGSLFLRPASGDDLIVDTGTTFSVTPRLNVSAGTASTSTSTGALVVTGGVGIGGALNCGAGAKFGNNTTLNNVSGYMVVQSAAALFLRATAGSDLTIDIGNSLQCAIAAAFTAGIVSGSPTGGNKGAGTINATAVYDDNVLLTCFGTEYAATAGVNLAQWDAVSPTGKHALAHKFVAMLKDFDPRDPAQYIARMLRDRALPGMPTPQDWQHGQLSMGEINNRLWLSVELLAAAFATTYKRLEALEAEQKHGH